MISERMKNLHPYVPGEQPRDMQYLKLNTNESPYPPSPKARALLDDKAASLLRLYSDPTGFELVQALSETFAIPAENLYVTGGSDEALYYAFLAYCDEKMPAVFPDVSYGFYPVLADLLGVEAKRIPLRDGFRLAPEDYFEAGGAVVIANPNAPTGRAITLDDIRAICAHGWGLTGTPYQPESQMEKLLFASDELTGLIGAAALMRPSKSCSDMELKSLKKKYKDKKFAAGCSREVIEQGAQMLGWELDELLQKTLDAMKKLES